MSREIDRKEFYRWVAGLITGALARTPLPGEISLSKGALSEALRARDQFAAAGAVELSPSAEKDQPDPFGTAGAVDDEELVGRAVAAVERARELFHPNAQPELLAPSAQGAGAGGGSPTPPPASVSWTCRYCGAEGPTLTSSSTLERHLEVCRSAPIKGGLSCDDVVAWLNGGRSSAEGERLRAMLEHLNHCPGCAEIDLGRAEGTL